METLQRLTPCHQKRHSHNSGYLAIVMSGKYQEVGDTGRWQIEDGDIIYHRSYEAHANIIIQNCEIMNIATPFHLDLPPVFTVSSIDELLYAVKSKTITLDELLIPREIKKPQILSWTDKLALDIQKSPIKLNQWAKNHGVRKETISRGFKKDYGVTPAQYRLLAQSRSALFDIVTSEKAFSQIAFETGFSDQAHLSRAIKNLTKISPIMWRRSIPFKT